MEASNQIVIEGSNEEYIQSVASISKNHDMYNCY